VQTISLLISDSISTKNNINLLIIIIS